MRRTCIGVVTLCLLVAGMATAAEVITNGAFTGDLNGWTASGFYYNSDPMYYRGSTAGSANSGPTSGSNIYQTFTSVPVSALADADAISFWWHNKGAFRTGKVAVYYVEGGFVEKTFDASVAQWRQVTIQKTELNAGYSINKIYFELTTGSLSNWYVDDVSIQTMVAVGEPGPGHPLGALRITPNPVVGGVAVLRVPGVQGSRGQVAHVRVFDAAGRCALARSFDIRDWSFGLPLDLRGLSSGVYLVRLDADSCTATQTLVVQRKDGRD